MARRVIQVIVRESLGLWLGPRVWVWPARPDAAYWWIGDPPAPGCENARAQPPQQRVGSSSPRPDRLRAIGHLTAPTATAPLTPVRSSPDSQQRRHSPRGTASRAHILGPARLLTLGYVIAARLQRRATSAGHRSTDRSLQTPAERPASCHRTPNTRYSTSGCVC
jgi:hypothetical protein